MVDAKPISSFSTWERRIACESGGSGAEGPPYVSPTQLCHLPKLLRARKSLANLIYPVQPSI